MSLLKTRDEINQIIQGGKIVGRILETLEKTAKAGMSTYEVDKLAEELILEAGGIPAFKNYKNHPKDTAFPCTICASVNDELVHGIARKDVVLKDGDIFKIDIGMQYPKNNGYFTDTAVTVAIGTVDPKAAELMRVTKASLEEGIKAARPGNSVADIGKAIERYIKSQGNYGIVRDLVGHGVGHEVHEEPRVPNYYDKHLEKFKLRAGMVIAIEPMVALGGWGVETGDDGWTIVMGDGSQCAHYEHTVIITDRGPIVATRRPGEKK